MSQVLKRLNSIQSAKVVVRQEQFGDFAALLDDTWIVHGNIQTVYPLEAERNLIFADECLLLAHGTSTSRPASRELLNGFT